MRLFPIIAAVAVMALIYGFVFERERIAALVGDEATAQTEASDEPGPEDTPEFESVGVVAIKSQAREIDSAVVLRGQTEAFRQVELRAETSGLAISEPLRKGTMVDKGEELCRLDPGTRAATLAETQARLAEAQARVPEARARLAEAQSRLEEAQINDRAAQALSQDGFASETRVASTKAAVSSAEAAVETARSGLATTRSSIQSAEAAIAAAEKEIERLTITAPFAGLLETDTAELGSLLQPGGLCATVIQLDPVMLVGFVSETEVSRVETGALAVADLASGGRVEGEVVFLSRKADPTTRTFRVDIRVPNPDLRLRDGQTAEITIAADGTKAHLLPQSALTLNDEGTLGVRLVQDDNSAGFHPVTLLRDNPNGVWLAGLPEQANVIVIGQEYVTDGVKVDPTYRELGQ